MEEVSALTPQALGPARGGGPHSSPCLRMEGAGLTNAGAREGSVREGCGQLHFCPRPRGRPCPLRGPWTPISEEMSSSRVSGTVGGPEAGAPESHSWEPSTAGKAAHQKSPRPVGTVEGDPEASQQAGIPGVAAAANSRCAKYAFTFALSAMSWSDFFK